MAKYKIKIDKKKCISCGTCVALAPKTFEMGDDTKVKLLKKAGDDDKTILQAAESCPVLAITLKDKDGKKIFPN